MWIHDILVKDTLVMDISVKDISVTGRFGNQDILVKLLKIIIIVQSAPPY